MSGLEIFSIIASFASIASLVFAGFVYHREKLRQAREEGTIDVFRERLRGIANNLNATAQYLQHLIRRADDTEAPARELQNMARGVRSGLLSALMDAQQMTIVLEKWEVGARLGIGSEPQRPPEEEREIEDPLDP